MVTKKRSEDSPHQSRVYNMMIIAKKLKKKGEETWSLLPDDLLWKIKERLNFVQNLYMAAVCKDWRRASSSCPRRSIANTRFSLPWFMDCRVEDSSEQEFIDPWHRKKYTIQHPDLVEAKVVYSKQGWLLLIKAYYSPSLLNPLTYYSPFLLNPLTGTKIWLPNLPHIKNLGGTFSVSDGVPGHVVFAGYDYDGKIRRSAFKDFPPSFFITSTTSEMCWRKYTPSLGWPVRFMLCDGGFLIVGSLVYYLDDIGGMLVFDLESLEWRDHRRIKCVYDWCDDHIMECEGEIINVRVGRHIRELKNGVRFFKLNLSNNNDKSSSQKEASWKELKDDDPLLQDRAWFIGLTCSAGFTRKLFGGGLMSSSSSSMMMKKLVYYEYSLIFQDQSRWIVYKNDGLEKSSVHDVDPPFFHPPSWVDIS